MKIEAISVKKPETTAKDLLETGFKTSL